MIFPTATAAFAAASPHPVFRCVDDTGVIRYVRAADESAALAQARADVLITAEPINPSHAPAYDLTDGMSDSQLEKLRAVLTPPRVSRRP